MAEQPIRETARQKQFKQRKTTRPSAGRFRKFKLKPNADPNYLEIYIKYTSLDNTTLVSILNQIEIIKDELITNYNFQHKLIGEFTKEHSLQPTLDISLIHTGQSVVIRFRNGWFPKISIDRSDLVIEVPKVIGICGLVLYSLYLGYDKVLDLENKRLDNQLKKQELKEYIKKEVLESDSIKANQATIQLLNYIQLSPNVTYFRANNLVLKNSK